VQLVINRLELRARIGTAQSLKGSERADLSIGFASVGAIFIKIRFILK
jgi:hypothetical protein